MSIKMPKKQGSEPSAEEFIAGAVQLISLGRLSLEGSIESASVPAETTPVARTIEAPQWSKIQSTAPMRTLQQPFEAPNVALKDLTRQPGRTFPAEGTRRANGDGP